MTDGLPTSNGKPVGKRGLLCHSCPWQASPTRSVPPRPPEPSYSEISSFSSQKAAPDRLDQQAVDIGPQLRRGIGDQRTAAAHLVEGDAVFLPEIGRAQV